MRAALTSFMICSKSAVLSGLMATVRIAVSPSNVSALLLGASCAFTASPWKAGSNRSAPASRNPDSRRIFKPPGKGGKAFTLPQTSPDENGHDLMSKKHSCPCQSQGPAVIEQNPLIHEGLKLLAVPGPHVHHIPVFHGR